MIVTDNETFGKGEIELEEGDHVHIKGGYFPGADGVIASLEGDWDYGDEDDKLFYVPVEVDGKIETIPVNYLEKV